MAAVVDKSTQQIEVTLGEVQYTWPVVITETEGKDISTSTIEVSVSTDHRAPGTWRTPDKDVSGPDNVRAVQLLVDDTFEPNSYWIWVRVTDNPEVVIMRAAQFIVV